MATSNQIMQRDTTQVTEAGKWMAQREANIQRLCPQGIHAAYIVQAAMMAIRRDPRLAACEPASIVAATLESAYVGFPVNTSQQLAFFVPYGRECQFQIGWKGLAALANQDDRVSHVFTYPVYRGDEFRVVYGTSPKIEHAPGVSDRSDDGDIEHVYAVVQYRAGGHDFEVMTRDQVEAIRAKSPGKASPAWKEHWGEMARKTALKRLLKRVGVSPRADQIIETDNRRAMGERVSVADAIPVHAADVATDLPQAPDPLADNVRPAADDRGDDAADDLGLSPEQLKRRANTEGLTR